ncbi:MAG: radical SAM protein [Bacteroidetes bacterium]|nr:radical SAM protein [Bacteroidota bacterium]
MYFSKYNIFSRIRNSENYYLVNILSGSADILDAEQASDYQNGNLKNLDEYIEKGYYTDEKEESQVFKNKYLEFLDEREKEEVQIFFVPSYACNFACTYCYQDEYSNENKPLTKEIIDTFFSYIQIEFANRNKYITLFGGEPLLNGKNHKENIDYFLEKSKEHNIPIAIVTNGYHLLDYLESIKNSLIKEIQLTLDGTEKTHNSRRFLKDHTSTFNEVVNAVDALLESEINVNLRVVVDKDNISDLPELAKFAINRGWAKSNFFKTQLGRNYELHHCQVENSRLFTRIGLYESLFDLIEKFPEITEFHKPAFSISKFLFESGELPEPLFDSCPACKSEWAFDYTGKIYPCTATVGKQNEEIGSFYPNVYKNIDLIDNWEERDVTSIEKCKNCNLQLACGGGCASVAKNISGEICSPDCRPIKELLELGFSHYFEK